MSQALRVGLLFGGRSVEHEVSVVSARGVAAAMDRTALRYVPLAVTETGRWLSPEVSGAILAGAGPRVEPSSEQDDGVRIVVDPGRGGLLCLGRDGNSRGAVEIDVLFPLVHGWGGEDGRVQGALELAGVPYVGAGVLGSAAGMDKALAKQLFAAHGLTVVPWRLATREAWREAPRETERRVGDELGFPLFVKPSNGGSSVGVTKVVAADQLPAALELAFAHDRRVLVERGVAAREIECAVIGNDRPEVSGLGEIVPSREFYDYAAKYLDAASELLIPAAVDEAVARSAREAALVAYRALDLCGFARVDFLLERETGIAYLNEVNTLPGFTPISMFPKLWEAAGLAYPKLVERLVELGRERWREEAARQTRRSSDRAGGDGRGALG